MAGAEGEVSSLDETPMEIEAYDGPADIKLWEPPTLTFEVQVVFSAPAALLKLYADGKGGHRNLTRSWRGVQCGVVGELW